MNTLLEPIAPPSNLPPVLPFVPAEDPVLPLPSPEQMAEALREHPREFVAFIEDRQRRIKLRQTDPYRHGYKPDIWHVVDDLLVADKRVVLCFDNAADAAGRVPAEIAGGAEVFISGANRSSKTEYAACKCVRVLVETPVRRGWSFHTTGPSSIAMQQPRVWKYLPAEWKRLKKNAIQNISYSQKGGFTEATFVLPNRSQHWFKNYAQDIDTIEGDELDVCWCDELVPASVLETMRFRLATRKGILIITFTPIKGYTQTVADLVDGARTVLDVPAELLPIVDTAGRPGFERVPRVQQGRRQELKIVYFHFHDNPFGGGEEVRRKLIGATREMILARAYGVATKAMTARFPRFSDTVHVIPDDQVPVEGTNYNIMDPCSGRNWAMIWARATLTQIFIYREWPCPVHYIPGVGMPGEWAIPDGKKHDGRAGRAQEPFGWGFERYKEEILRVENLDRNGATRAGGPETIFERYIDPRYGASPIQVAKGSYTLIEALDQLGLYYRPVPAKANIDEGIDLVNDLLDYDLARPIGADNYPRLVIAENCRNTIWALKNWTGADGATGACKDIVDLVRYLAVVNPQHYTKRMLQSSGGGSY